MNTCFSFVVRFDRIATLEEANKVCEELHQTINDSEYGYCVAETSVNIVENRQIMEVKRT